MYNTSEKTLNYYTLDSCVLGSWSVEENLASIPIGWSPEMQKPRVLRFLGQAEHRSLISWTKNHSGEANRQLIFVLQDHLSERNPDLSMCSAYCWCATWTSKGNIKFDIKQTFSQYHDQCRVPAILNLLCFCSFWSSRHTLLGC